MEEEIGCSWRWGTVRLRLFGSWPEPGLFWKARSGRGVVYKSCPRHTLHSKWSSEDNSGFEHNPSYSTLIQLGYLGVFL